MRTKKRKPWTPTIAEARELDRQGYVITGFKLEKRRRLDRKSGKRKVIPVITLTVSRPPHV